MDKSPFYRIDLRVLPEVRAFSIRNDRRPHSVRQTERESHVCEISFLQAGTLTESVKGEERILQEGSICAFAHNLRRKFISDDESFCQFGITLTLHSPAAVCDAEDLAAHPPQSHEAILPGYIADPRICQKITPHLRKLMQECGARTAPVRHLQVNALLFHILDVLTQYAISLTQESAPSGQRDAEHCALACKYIEDNLGRKFSIPEIADHVGISYYYLCRLFPRVMGINLTQYINREKLRQAQRLIAEGRLSVEQAGASVGIDDPKYLSRLFRRHFGMTISEFKRQLENK